MERLLVLGMTAIMGMAVPVAVSAQSGDQAKRVDVTRAAEVWGDARDGGVWGRYDDRDSDSDSDSDSRWDSDSDSDSDSDARWRNGERGSRDCRVVERDLDRAHERWHRQNDRYRGDRRYEAEHDRMHDRMDQTRARAGCRRSTASTIGDIIFGRPGSDRERDRDRDDRGRRDGGVLDRLPIPGDDRDRPRRGTSVHVDDLGALLRGLTDDG